MLGFANFYLSSDFIVGIVDISLFISLRLSTRPYFQAISILPIFLKISINIYNFAGIGSKLVQTWFRIHLSHVCRNSHFITISLHISIYRLPESSLPS